MATDVMPSMDVISTRDTVQVEHFDFAPGLCDRIAEAALIVSHAGAGSLFEALGAGKVVVAVPNALLMHNHQVCV